MRYIYAFVLAQLCVCFNVVCSQNAVLSGRVVDQDTKQAIEFANISFTDYSRGTSSGSDGVFQMSDLNEGSYELRVSCIGYEQYKQHIQIKKGKNTLSVELKASVENLSPIVITGTGTQHRIENVPVQTEIISGKTIQEISGRSVEEVIAGISSSFDYTPSAMGANVKINGLSKDYILVLIDGKRMTGDIGGRIDLNRINANDIEQIEIVKGASSTLYGSDAIAGVINIITKKSERKISVTNSTRLGAYNEWNQLNTVTVNTNKLSSKTSFSRKQTDGWQLSNMEYNPKWKKNINLPFLRPTYDMPVNKKHSYTLDQAFTYNKSERLKLNLDLSWYEKTLYFPFKGRMQNYYYNNIGASFGGKYKLVNKDYLDFNASYGNYKYYDDFPYKKNVSYLTKDGLVSRTYYPGDRFKKSDQINFTSQVKGVFNLNSVNTLSVGTEVLVDYLEAKYSLIKDNASDHTISIYAQDELKLSKDFNVVGGVRVIYNSIFGVIATPKVSAMYKSSGFTYRASWSKGFKAPTLKELYYYNISRRLGMRRLYLGNEDLKPQKSDYYSLSVEYKYNRLRASLNTYINQIHNMIDYKIIRTTADPRLEIEETKQRYNISEAQNIGFDFMFQANLFSGFSLGGGYSYVDAQNLTQDIKLNGVSDHSATFKASWSKKWKRYDLKLNLMGRYKSEKFYLEEDLNRNYAKPYQIWKLTTNHTIRHFKKAKIVLIAGVDNVFDYVDDSPYGSHYGTLNPGRTLFAGINIDFGL